MIPGARVLLSIAYLLAQVSLVMPLASRVAAAQAADPTVPLNPSSILFDHDGRDLAGFAAYITPKDRPSLRFDLGPIRPDASGHVVARLPQLPPGTYSLEVVAYNGSGESPRVVAQPGRFEITGSTADVAEPTPDWNGVQPKETGKAPQQKKRSLWGTIYRGVVGSDDDEQKKP